MNQRKNWAGNYVYQAERLQLPETVDDVRAIVAGSRRIKALGTRHCFNDLADSPDAQISLQRLRGILDLDTTNRRVTVEAGIRYGDLCGTLNNANLALHNLASLPHISIAGACQTATHGSGDTNRCLATAVSALEMVIADGSVVRLSREQNEDQFAGAVVGLGALGVVTKLTLDLVPAFTVRQDVYENLPLPALLENFDTIVSSAYSVSLFTDWKTPHINQIWRKRRVITDAPVEMPPTFFGATQASRSHHPLDELDPRNCTAQLGVPGAWHERLPHFRMEFTPSSGQELQSEYLVPRPHAIAALETIAGLREQIAPLLQVAEIRTIAADDLWLSPFYQQDSVAFHFTWLPDQPTVLSLLPHIEEQLAPFGARPHWGKLFTTPPARLQSLYEKLPDFLDLRGRYDPDGKFRNLFLDRLAFV